MGPVDCDLEGLFVTNGPTCVVEDYSVAPLLKRLNSALIAS
jgi:hypothetical protein